EVLATAEELVESDRLIVARHDGGELFVTDLEFAEQVAIYHIRPFRSDSSARPEGVGPLAGRGDLVLSGSRPLPRPGSPRARAAGGPVGKEETRKKTHPSTQGVGRRKESL